MLSFHQDIVSDLYPLDSAGDMLLVLGRGLGLNIILENIIALHSDPRNLVLVLNVKNEQVNSQTPPKQRNLLTALYLSGGVLTVTSRILVVDLLNKTIPTHLLTGIIVCNAHTVAESSTIAFILRLFRQENKQGFIKAFSDEPEALVNGPMKLARLVKTLLVQSVIFWPRFHVNVIKDINQVGILKLVEIRVPLSNSMRRIQTGLLECLNESLKEIKRCNPGIQVTDITLENAFFGSFDRNLHSQLEMLIIGPKTKQLLKDIAVLRHLLDYLLSYDCASFNIFLETILASNASNSKSVFSDSISSPWLALDDAQIVFEYSRNRVFSSLNGTIAPNLEEQPKWKTFISVITEIRKKRQEANGLGNILVMVKNIRTQRQLQKMLSTFNECSQKFSNLGIEQILTSAYKRFINWKKLSKPNFAGDEASQTNLVSKRRRIRGGLKSGGGLSHADLIQETQDYSTPNLFEELESHIIDNEQEPSTHDSDVIVSIYEHLDISSASLLTNIMPAYIVIYDPDVSFVRQIEIFKSQNPEHRIEVYFLVYDNSVEEQKYLSLIRREKESFEKLIYQNSKMVIPLDSDGRAIIDAEDYFWENTYHAGGQLLPRPELSVLVDMREFRSSLPFLLHSFHMKVVPCTLEVGDYILSPDICVERKSVSDLAQSLKSGRLYSQCQAMAANYSIYALLIEFEEGRSFRMRSRFDTTDIASGLTLLLIHFPKLRVIWSASSAQTAKIFKDLKKDRDEPNLEKAISIGSDTATSQYNIIPSEILKAMPGVTFKNHQIIMKNVKNLKELSEMNAIDLSKLIGDDSAKQLLDFIRKKQVIC